MASLRENVCCLITVMLIPWVVFTGAVDQIENKKVSMKHFDEAIKIIEGTTVSQDSSGEDWIQRMETVKPATPLFDFTKAQE